MKQWSSNEDVSEEKDEDEDVVASDIFKVTVIFTVKAYSADDAEGDVKTIIDEGLIKAGDDGIESVKSYDVTDSEPEEVY